MFILWDIIHRISKSPHLPPRWRVQPVSASFPWLGGIVSQHSVPTTEQFLGSSRHPGLGCHNRGVRVRRIPPLDGIRRRQTGLFNGHRLLRKPVRFRRPRQVPGQTEPNLHLVSNENSRSRTSEGHRYTQSSAKALSEGSLLQPWTTNSSTPLIFPTPSVRQVRHSTWKRMLPVPLDPTRFNRFTVGRWVRIRVRILFAILLPGDRPPPRLTCVSRVRCANTVRPYTILDPRSRGDSAVVA